MKITALLLAVTAAATAKPNIVFVLVDDWGYADVSFRNPSIYTPNFQDLAENGVLLDRHYVYKVCSPSRVSFLTGRWPHHAHQYNIAPHIQLGANINMTMIPAKLKTAGYKTHIVGKWHQGFYDPVYLPINRGFDTSSGFLTGGSSHMDQVARCAVDYWKNNEADTRNGTYDSYIYKSDVTKIITNHDESYPFFLYLALHNVHWPIEVPNYWKKLYPVNSTCSRRRDYQAMVSVADYITGHVVKLLKKKNMWNNTIFVVSSDNGAVVGSNYPLKGAKGTFFEGGVRALAFVSGGLIPENMRGKSTDGFIHIADWYTTFCKLAGVDSEDSGTGKFPVDGLDVWPIITGNSTTTLHDEIVLGYNSRGRGAIISRNYKLIVGNQEDKGNHLMWTPLDYPCHDGPTGEDCNPYCLYDIVNDPKEEQNLIDKDPDLLQKMLDKYNAYGKEPPTTKDQYYNRRGSLPGFDGACQYMKEKGGYWRPWKNTQD